MYKAVQVDYGNDGKAKREGGADTMLAQSSSGSQNKARGPDVVLHTCLHEAWSELILYYSTLHVYIE